MFLVKTSFQSHPTHPAVGLAGAALLRIALSLLRSLQIKHQQKNGLVQQEGQSQRSGLASNKNGLSLFYRTMQFARQLQLWKLDRPHSTMLVLWPEGTRDVAQRAAGPCSPARCLEVSSQSSLRSARVWPQEVQS